MTTATINRNESLATYVEKMEATDSPRATVTLPAPGGGADWQMHRKNLEHALSELSKDETVKQRFGEKAGKLLQTIRERMADQSEWSGDYEAICLHATADDCRVWKLDFPVEQQARIGEHFYYKEAATAIESRFDGLAMHLALKDPKLYRVRGDRALPLKTDEMPSSIYAFSEQEIVDGGQRAHVRVSGQRGNAGPEMVRQGNSGGRESTRDLNEDAFFREVTKALSEVGETEQLPLVVIGDEKLVSSFDAAYSQGGFLRVTDADSHPDEQEVARICDEAARAAADGKRAQILEQLRTSDPTNERYSDNLKEIYEASLQGRILVAAVARDASVFSEYNEEKATLTSIKEESSGIAYPEVLSDILKESVTKEGRCIAVPESELPEDKKAVALYKW